MKLFKKVAAAVLAGVMALSMVACGTTPVTPDAPVAPVEDSAVAQILTWANYGRVKANELMKENNPFGAEIKEYKLIENDADLAKQAQVILDLLKADEKDIVAYQKDGSIWVSQAAVAKKLFNQDITGNVYVLAGNNAWAPVTKGTKNYVIPADSLKLDLDSARKAKLSAWGMAFDEDVKRIGDKLELKIGIASATINGETCVVAVSNT